MTSPAVKLADAAIRRPATIPIVLFGGLAIMAGVACGWFIIEANLLEDGADPMTFYTRNYLSWHPKATALACYAIGAASAAAVVHFVADRDMGRPSKGGD